MDHFHGSSGDTPPATAQMNHTAHLDIQSPVCEQCERHDQNVNYCNVCEILFCDECWIRQFVHRKHTSSSGSTPHEKTRPKVAEKVRNALSAPASEAVLAQMCRDDELTSWFGIERASDNGPPIFQDYGRFSDLMSSTNPTKRSDRTSTSNSKVRRDIRAPSLVSFVGQTGAGKSTLIKLLIDLACDDSVPALSRQESLPFETPVVGASEGNLPTSEDVHLYIDPRTAYTNSPILFADCEGLEGGEREPAGAKMKRRRRHQEEMGESRERTGTPIAEQKLRWANSPQTRTREFAVTNLYPRLLYTFSDVIVFVLKNPRVVEHVFEKLIEWAAAAIETSSNQPVLPHAIIVLNASPTKIDPTLWDVNANTSAILDEFASIVDKNEIFKKYAQFWRSRGKTIETLEQLVASYYSSFQILRVPADGRPKLMHEQVGKLYRGIVTASFAAQDNKAYLRMLLDVEALQSYLTFAFDHFSGTLQSPFDFVQASFINSPIPANFGGNILKLAISIKNVWQKMTRPTSIFEALGYMVASCIMFESARNKVPGKVEQIFPKYLEHIDAALENFCDQHWPCEYVDQAMGAQCVNVRNGHGSKGHQLKNGKVFATGDYVSEISFAEYGSIFRDNVYWHLDSLLEDLSCRLYIDHERAAISGVPSSRPVVSTINARKQTKVVEQEKKSEHDRANTIVGIHADVNQDKHRQDARSSSVLTADTMPQRVEQKEWEKFLDNQVARNAAKGALMLDVDQTAADIHRDTLHSFYRDVAKSGAISELFTSHTACFCCLLEPPEHTLACGHVLCTSCVKLFGFSEDPNEVEMRECPLEENTRYSKWACTVFMKPKSAGVRTLVLDGGGIRGIVELEILRAIEDVMDVHLPIQCFFDLIVGTSTGGLIALGLGSMGWSVEHCIEKFQSMCRTAFTRRVGSTVPGIRILVDNHYHSKYKTKPFEETLKMAFTEDEYLFGGPKRHTTSRIKVAVTATSVTGRAAIVFGNYNRLCDENLQYEFQRSERADLEMKIWEAARATSAAPMYFKAFHHQATQKNLIDGAIWHNNPIRIAEQERKLIWPELEEQYADIVLSLGTATSQRLRRTESLRMPPQIGIVAHASKLVNLLKNHMATSIECERLWDAFLTPLPKSIKALRFVRINPELPGDVPMLDEVDKMIPLRETVEQWLENRNEIKHVAIQLIATCFYLELVGSVIVGTDAGYIANGRFCCRFPHGSDQLQELGRFLLKQGRVVKFLISEQSQVSESGQQIDLPAETVSNMIHKRRFEMPMVSFKVSGRASITTISLFVTENNIHSISGFPRSIFADEAKIIPSRRAAVSNPNRWAGSSVERERERQKWTPPVKENNPSLALLAKYSNPMQSQQDLPSQVSKREVRKQLGHDGGEAFVEKASRLFRTAFRALVRPVRARPPPSYGEWLATLEPDSDATLEDYYRLCERPEYDLRTRYKLEEKVAPGKTTLEMDDEGGDGEKVEQSQVYNSWLDGLQIPQSTLSFSGSAFVLASNETGSG